MNYTKRLTKPVVLASVFVLFCLSIWVLSAPSVRAQNYVVIFNGPMETSGDCTQPVIFAGQCPASQDNPGTMTLEYRLRLTQPSAKPGEQIGLLLDLAVKWHYDCPTQTESCSFIGNEVMGAMLAFSGQSVPPPEGANGPVLPPIMAFSIDTGGLTAQPLIVQANWVQILGLGDTAPQDYQNTGTATTYLTIPAGIPPATYQLQAILRTTPSVITENGVTANDVASFSWSPTEPVSLYVGVGQAAAATTATAQNIGQSASTPVGLTIPTPDASTNAAEGAVAATIGGLASVGVGAALSHFTKPTEPTPVTIEESESTAYVVTAQANLDMSPTPTPAETQQQAVADGQSLNSPGAAVTQMGPPEVPTDVHWTPDTGTSSPSTPVQPPLSPGQSQPTSAPTPAPPPAPAPAPTEDPMAKMQRRIYALEQGSERSAGWNNLAAEAGMIVGVGVALTAASPIAVVLGVGSAVSCFAWWMAQPGW